MKLLLVVFACLGLSHASLSEDLLDLIGVVPLDDWMEISAKFRMGDSEYQRLLRYLQEENGEWRALVDRVGNNGEWKDFKGWMLERGVDLDARIDQIHDLIASLEIGDGGDMGGLRALVDECLALFSLDSLLAKLDSLLTNSADFREFFEEISSNESKDFLEGFLFVDAEVQRLIEEAYAAGIDVARLKEVLYGILGWD